MNSYLYLTLNIVSILYPLLKTWDKRVDMLKNQKQIWISTFLIALFFIIWDILFTKAGFWGFNPDYLIGVNIVNLPIEEILFFFCIPYACIFIFEVIRYYDTRNIFEKPGKWINAALIILTLILFTLGYDKWYTSVTSVLLIMLLLAHQFLIKNNRQYLGRFYLSFIFILIPFLVVNGILTGSFIPEQVVWYNDLETISIRIFTIPLEDIFYCMLMMLSIVTIYQTLVNKRDSLSK